MDGENEAWTDLSEVERWLSSAGYRYHCFISWPHSPNPELKQWASALRDGIEKELAYHINKPRVFLDDAEITGGADWEKTLRSALCHSLSLVAVCAPIYFNPEHDWCGLEWAAMDLLCQQRFPDEDFRANIPVIIRAPRPLPPPLLKVQPVDLSRLATKSRNYARTNEFRRCVLQIVERILGVARAIKHRDARTNCDQFEMPPRSAFFECPPPQQPFPLRNE